jgi:hypothetical protein
MLSETWSKYLEGGTLHYLVDFVNSALNYLKLHIIIDISTNSNPFL